MRITVLNMAFAVALRKAYLRGDEALIRLIVEYEMYQMHGQGD